MFGSVDTDREPGGVSADTPIYYTLIYLYVRGTAASEQRTSTDAAVHGVRLP